jgi:predicted transcriptional regulator
MELSPLDLKFLLRLLEHAPNYRSKISNIKPEAKTPASERNRICKSLCSRGLVEYTDEIQQYQTTAAGKTLLKSDTSTLPVSVSSNELFLLKVATTKAVTPGTASKVPAGDRQQLLSQLKERGLITVNKSQIKDVWLTSQGTHYLLNDCVPTSSIAKLSFSMLGNYLTFLRQSLGQKGAAIDTQVPNTQSAPTKDSSLTPEAVLDTIRQLDRQFDTDNFLPIFHLREKLQPPLGREDLDRLLYELQRRDSIEFSTLQDVSNYREIEVAAGIPQNIGGVLFYISVTD